MPRKPISTAPPSTVHFDPMECKVIGVHRLNDPAAVDAAEAAALDDGYASHPAQRQGRCGHCGSRIVNAALLGLPDRSTLWVGETCLGGSLGAATAGFDEIRSQQKTAREHAKRAAAFTAHLEDAVVRNWVLEVLGHLPAMQAELTTSLRFATDVRQRMDRWPLTGKQVEALATAITRDREQQAQPAQPQCPVPEGANRVSGTVTRTQMKQGFGGTEAPQMTVRDERGFVVSGAAPAALLRMVGEDLDALLGRFVEVDAVLSQGRSRPSWGWFKSPRNPVLITVCG